MEKIIKWLSKIFHWEDMSNDHITEIEFIPIATKSRAELLYETAKDLLQPQKDVSPLDLAPDEVGCCESLEEVYRKTFGTYIGGKKPILNTWELLVVLSDHPSFKRVDLPVPGTIVVNATGSGNGNVRGHTGVCGVNWIMANNSFNSYWSADYTYPAWERNFVIHGGMKTHYFLPV